MLNEKIDALIMESLKSKKMFELKVYKLIKTKFQEFKTARNAKPLDEAAEIQILRKMILERQKSIEAYKNGGREDLARVEQDEIDVINQYLPKPVTHEEIQKALDSINLPREKAYMSQIIGEVKRILPGAEGKMISEVVKKNIEGC